MVYNCWRKELELNRKRKFKHNNTIMMDREPHPHQNSAGWNMNRSRRPSHRKSNSVESSETNATLNEKERSVQGGSIKFSRPKEAYLAIERNNQDDSVGHKNDNATPYFFEKKQETGITKLQRKPAEKKTIKKT